MQEVAPAAAVVRVQEAALTATGRVPAKAVAEAEAEVKAEVKAVVKAVETARAKAAAPAPEDRAAAPADLAPGAQWW